MPKLERIAAVLAQSEPEQAELLTAIAAFGSLTQTLANQSDAVKEQVASLAKQQGQALAKLAKTLFDSLATLSERISALENKKPADYAPAMRSLKDDIGSVNKAVASIRFPDFPVPRETDLSPVLAALAKYPIVTESPKREYRMEVAYDQWGDVTGAKFIEL